MANPALLFFSPSREVGGSRNFSTPTSLDVASDDECLLASWRTLSDLIVFSDDGDFHAIPSSIAPSVDHATYAESEVARVPNRDGCARDDRALGSRGRGSSGRSRRCDSGIRGLSISSSSGSLCVRRGSSSGGGGGGVWLLALVAASSDAKDHGCSWGEERERKERKERETKKRGKKVVEKRPKCPSSFFLRSFFSFLTDTLSTPPSPLPQSHLHRPRPRRRTPRGGKRRRPIQPALPLWRRRLRQNAPYARHRPCDRRTKP